MHSQFIPEKRQMEKNVITAYFEMQHDLSSYFWCIFFCSDWKCRAHDDDIWG